MTRNWTAGEWWEWVRLEYRSGDRIGIITKIQKKRNWKEFVPRWASVVLRSKVRIGSLWRMHLPLSLKFCAAGLFQAACCASTSSAAHCHVDLSWYKWHGDPHVSRQGLAVLFGFVVPPWRSERVEAVGFQSFLYEQRYRICFQSHQNTRAAQKLKLNGKCIRHSDVFVWNGVWVFAQLFS